MDAPEAKSRLPHRLLAVASVALLATAACAPQAAAPTAAPAKPAATVVPAKPAPTTAPAKPAATTAPAKPAATAAPAVKPTEKPAAKPAEFDEKAVADFYKGKTVRIIVGYGPGGTTDLVARLLQQVWSKYIPGNPTIVVENRPGAGSMLAANTVFASEPQDGTVVVATGEVGAVAQAIGLPGVQFDAAKYQWLGSTYDSPGACAVRTDAGITSFQEMIASGKEVAVSSYGKNTNSYDPPVVMNVALGSKFKVVTGYDSGATQILAVKNKEVQGWCTSYIGFTTVASDMLEGANPPAKIIVVMAPAVPKEPLLKDAVATDTLAKTEEAKALLKPLEASYSVQIPHGVAPGVPKDRVQALRRARDKAYADPEFRASAEKAKLFLSPKTGEEVNQAVQGILSTPPATLAKLKQTLE